MTVISGGQTGIDQLGLHIAEELGIPTGGTAPKGFRTENGPDPSLAKYGLVEHESFRYEPRTYKNVADADATVIFGDIKSPGSQTTIAACVHHKKPYLCNPTVPQLVAWLIGNGIQVLKVAGNRGSKLTALQLRMYGEILRAALQLYISSAPGPR